MSHDSTPLAFAEDRRQIDRRAIPAIEQPVRTPARERSPYYPIGTSTTIVQVRRLLEQVAGFDTNVLITGESGTGKEWAARVNAGCAVLLGKENVDKSRSLNRHPLGRVRTEFLNTMGEE